MSKKVTNRFSFLLCISLLLLCAAALFPIKAKAEETDPEEPPLFPNNRLFYEYNLGKKVEANMEGDTGHTYHFNVLNSKKNNRYFITLQTYGQKAESIIFENEKNGAGEMADILTTNDFKCQYDKKSKIYTYTGNVTCWDGHFWLSLHNFSDSSYRYSFTITSEPEIVLDKTAISEITNTKSHTMTVKYAPVKKRLGYQIEYADNSKFNNKARVNTGATTKNIGKLTIGKTYYVRVRVYARYDNGTLVYSKWSGTRKVKIKK